MLNNILHENSMTKYRLSKLSNVPYATINDICSGKADIRKCSVDTVYKISGALGVTMEELLKPYFTDRPDFDLFKSDVCHRLKEMGDIDFIIDILESNIIYEYYDKEWYPESLYLLAMLDYLSRENNVPTCHDYDKLRHCKLSRPVYPASIIAMSEAKRSNEPRENAMRNSIPEFLRHNIIESEVRNVI